MHHDGEVDIRCEIFQYYFKASGKIIYLLTYLHLNSYRGAYCAAVAARITNIYVPQLFHNTGEWIKR